jgi:hypothetical protein
VKNFRIEFLVFPGLEVHCKLCEALIKDRQEETIVPTLYYGEQFQGPICEMCYKDLPQRVNASKLPRFGG